MKKEVKIGLTGIAALLILFFGINYLKGINMFTPDSYYIVDFTNINGLAKSSPVYANGYKIGIVRDIQYNHNKPGHVAVEIEIDQNINVPEGSTAELVTEMLGTVKMNVSLNYSNHKYCEPGDTIYGMTNEGLMGIAEKEIMPQMEQMLPKLDSVLTSLNKLLSSPALTNSINNVEEITSSLKSTTKKLDAFMTVKLPVIANNATAVTENLKGISEKLKDVNYQATFKNIENTLANVQSITDKLSRKDNSAGLLLNDDEFYQNLNSTLDNASSLLKDLEANPKRYVHFSLFGRKNKGK